MLPSPATLGVLLNTLQPSLITRPFLTIVAKSLMSRLRDTHTKKLYSFRRDSIQSIPLKCYHDFIHVLKPDNFSFPSLA